MRFDKTWSLAERDVESIASVPHIRGEASQARGRARIGREVPNSGRRSALPGSEGRRVERRARAIGDVEEVKLQMRWSINDEDDDDDDAAIV